MPILGTATIKAAGKPELITDGPCLRGTLANLEMGGFGAEPMTPAALEPVRSTALQLLEDVVSAYDSAVASGEVGVGGTGVAKKAAPKVSCPTGLLYGRIQSGKTVGMITFTAAALDNGFRVVVVLTSDFIKLVEQTTERFGALAGPRVESSLSTSYRTEAKHVAKHLGRSGLVFVCAKNYLHLGSLVEYLDEIGASEYPAIVLDDEADQATLDVWTNARARGHASAPKAKTGIHRRAVEDEEGQSVRQRLRHHVFVGVTATPYALLLQNVDNPLRPQFARVMDAGDGYTGGESFVDDQHISNPEPPLVYVDEQEATRIKNASAADDTPDGLRKAIAFFLVAAGAQIALDPRHAGAGQNFLCHTSIETKEHAKVAHLIREYLGRVEDELEDPSRKGEVWTRIDWAYKELSKTLSAPPLDKIVEAARRRLPLRQVPEVNSKNDRVAFGRNLNFIVGGNILGRGLTIKNLLVTYYLRRAKISQMDTVLQHARMYGYRKSIMPITRVFLPEDLAFKFHHIHTAETGLREQLRKEGPASHIAVATITGQLRATRLNVLDTGSLSAYKPGHHVFPTRPAFDERSLRRGTEVEKAIKNALGGVLLEKEYIEIPLSTMVDLIGVAPYDSSEANTWDPEALARLLNTISKQYGDRGYLYYRTMEAGGRGRAGGTGGRATGRFATGAVGVVDGHQELEEARSKGRPVLFLFKDSGRHLAQYTGGRSFWYPSVVLPETMATHVFNVTS